MLFRSRKDGLQRMGSAQFVSVTGPRPVSKPPVSGDIARHQGKAQRYGLPGCFVVHSCSSQWDRRITHDLRSALHRNFIVEIDYRDFRGDDLKERVLAGIEWASLAAR